MLLNQGDYQTFNFEPDFHFANAMIQTPGQQYNFIPSVSNNQITAQT